MEVEPEQTQEQKNITAGGTSVIPPFGKLRQKDQFQGQSGLHSDTPEGRKGEREEEEGRKEGRNKGRKEGRKRGKKQ
jgi:hypothetical protein